MIISDFPRGEHKLELRKEDYRSYQTTVSVETHEETKLEPTLVPFSKSLLDARQQPVKKDLESGTDTVFKWIVWIGGVLFVGSLIALAAF